MTSISERGHAVNLANFQDLITVCKEMGADYNPSAAFLKLPGLEAKYLVLKMLASAQDMLAPVLKILLSFGLKMGTKNVVYQPVRVKGAF